MSVHDCVGFGCQTCAADGVQWVSVACPYCAGTPWYGVVPPSPCGPFCKGAWLAPRQFKVVTGTTFTLRPVGLSDEDVDRVARRVVELLRESGR